MLGLLVRDEPDRARVELESALAAQRGNVAKTARSLGVSVETMWRWIRLLGLSETVARARQAAI